MNPPRLPVACQWDGANPAPTVALRLLERRPVRVSDAPIAGQPFDFTAAMTCLCDDIVRRVPAFAHIDLSRVAVSIMLARNGRRHGLQARVTPLRFQGGAIATTYRGRTYQVQRFVVDRREILYLVTFCLPRFLNREFDDKLVTVFHELYHISPAFDGDLRRHGGRYCAHSGSQKKYDANMAKLVRAYLAGGADPERSEFLRQSFAQLCRQHGAVVGLHLPRPKLVPVPVTPPRPGPWTGSSPNGMPG